MASGAVRFPMVVVSLSIVGSQATRELRRDLHRKQSMFLLNTWESHLRNLIGGVSVGVEARMKVVAAHFPMKVQAKGESLLIENFLGEKHPRSAPLLPGVTASVEGDQVTLQGIDVEQVGQSAANVERATRIRNYDPRVFQDGIYLVVRAHLRESS